MPGPQELIAAVEQAAEAYAAFIARQSETAFHRRPAPDEWTAAELTGHVAEFPSTFAEQVRRLANNPSAPIGRSLEDPGRLSAVARLAGAGPAAAAGEVRTGLQQALATLGSIPAAGWEVRGQHPRFGSVSVAELVERLILSHLRDHLEQARAACGDGQ